MKHTRSIILITVIRDIPRTREERAPEGSTILSLSDAVDVNMANKTAFLKWLRERFPIDVIFKPAPQQNQQVIVTI
jgi:hypothetical protein